MKVAENLVAIEEKILQACQKSGRNPEEITIVAVTKYVSAERAQEAVAAGITNLGENRDEGLSHKYSTMKQKAVWHFIGSLQTKKVKNIIDKVEYIHSLDRISLAEEIQKRTDKQVKCFVQVNVSGENSKRGIEPAEALEFIKSLEGFDRLSVAGLMTMAPLTDNESVLRSCFKKLKELQGEIQDARLGHAPCTELSMGMSNDFPIAIEEGATIIRIGTALVGEDS
ncbi:YggS family pyridoxal phosphate-dependent enzyme [Peribacillus cavernae]|uniref:Pyridoxal phosphate homeostasis protein n=1 Tax=Peribacillus cavernae TaxID=1674310 RepID=A0A433HPZ0_9BACI|nr:YggS family pyridoxal phosphate-dependent enzyme [Peribacillus cavernae]MDQ0217161.1 pyridoxal phosphate enzyme (YggS family) [Peribacillus cavernae]RUQ30365.1 YggS family pyridoxal phosphate-dependent enzyme [Peribacillus cavernae]